MGLVEVTTETKASSNENMEADNFMKQTQIMRCVPTEYTSLNLLDMAWIGKAVSDNKHLITNGTIQDHIIRTFYWKPVYLPFR